MSKHSKKISDPVQQASDKAERVSNKEKANSKDAASKETSPQEHKENAIRPSSEAPKPKQGTDDVDGGAAPQQSESQQTLMDAAEEINEDVEQKEKNK